jgi:hypothetical protein
MGNILLKFENPFGTCGGQTGTATGFFSAYFGFLLSESFHQCSILNLILILLLSEGQAGKALQTKQCSLGNWGALDRKVLYHFFFSSVKNLNRS